MTAERLVVIRHAESVLSAGLSWPRRGRPDHLTERGRSQAGRAAHLLRGHADRSAVAVVCSPAPRARETAAIIAAASSHQAPRVDPALMEYPAVNARIARLRSDQPAMDSNDAAWNAYVGIVRAWLRRHFGHCAHRTIVVTHAGWMIAVQELCGQPRSALQVPRHCGRIVWHDSRWQYVDREG